MRVTVELISPLNVVTGRMEPFVVELAQGATTRDLIPVLGELVKGSPLIHRAMGADGIMFLVNRVHVTPNNALKEGDRVSLVLRISGI
jgi:molybdopterin converting factor small subunit